MSSYANGHADEEQLERYSMGQLSDEDCAGLEEHLLVCEACRERLTKMDAYVGAMQRASAELRRPEAKPRPRLLFLPRPVLAWAAGLAVVALAATVSVRLMSHGSGTAPIAVHLEATRGPAAVAHAPAGQPLRLDLDVSGLSASGAYIVEIVNASGAPLWEGPAAVEQSRAAANAPERSPGVYFVRLYSSSRVLLREYGLEVEARPK